MFSDVPAFVDHGKQICSIPKNSASIDIAPTVIYRGLHRSTATQVAIALPVDVSCSWSPGTFKFDPKLKMGWETLGYTLASEFVAGDSCLFSGCPFIFRWLCLWWWLFIDQDCCGMVVIVTASLYLFFGILYVFSI
jgi:hypothetical protein